MYIMFFLCVLLRIITIFFSWNFISFFIYVLGISCSVVLFYQILKKKLRPKYFFILLLFIAIVFFPQNWLVTSKFVALGAIYQTKVEDIIEETSYSQDSYLGEYVLKIGDRLLLNNLEPAVQYIKQDGLYVISFTKSRNFFQWYAIVYFSNPKAIDLITSPSKYQEDLSDVNSFDKIVWLKKDKWAFIKWY